MKENILVSPYKNNLIAKRSKILFSTLIDYFLVFILSFIFYVGVCSPIYSVTGVYKENVAGFNQGKEELYKIVGETRIQLYDEESKKLEDINDVFDRYLLSLVKTSYYLDNLQFPSYDGQHYVDVDIDINDTLFNLDNDNMTYYYLVFKTKEESLNNYVIDNEDYKDKKITYLYSKILGYSNYESYFTNDDSYLEKQAVIDYKNKYNLEFTKYSILNEETRDLLKQKLVYSDTSSKVIEIYNNFYNCYVNGANIGVNQVETYYTKYIETSNAFFKYYYNYLIGTIVCFIISYTLAFLVFNVFIYLLNKKKETIGNRVMKLGTSTIQEFDLSWKNKILSILSKLILYFSCMFLTVTFTNNFAAIVISSYGFSLLGFLLFSLLLDILSIILMFCKSNHQLLSSFVSFTLIKSTEEFENIPSKENENG